MNLISLSKDQKLKIIKDRLENVNYETFMQEGYPKLELPITIVEGMIRIRLKTSQNSSKFIDIPVEDGYSLTQELKKLGFDL